MTSASTSAGNAISTSSTRMMTVSTAAAPVAGDGPEQAADHEADRGDGERRPRTRPGRRTGCGRRCRCPPGRCRACGRARTAAAAASRMFPPVGFGTGYDQRPQEARAEEQDEESGGQPDPQVARPAAGRAARDARATEGVGPGGAAASGSGALIPDPRVQYRVQQVGEQVGRAPRPRRRRATMPSTTGTSWLVMDWISRSLPDAGQREDRLDDRRRADQRAQVERRRP